MIAQAMNWWTDGLAALFVALRGMFQPQRRFRLDTQVRPLVLRAAGNGAAIATFPANGTPAKLPPSLLQQLRGGKIEIVVPPAALLERKLDPLPGESRPYVENVVQHQIEALFPWRASDIFHATRVTDRDDGRLDVTVIATPRSAIEGAVGMVAGTGAGEIVIVGNDTAPGYDAAAIPVNSGHDPQERAARAQTVARYAIGALLIFALLAIGWTSFVRWSLESDLAGLDEVIADRRAVLKRASDPRGTGGGDSIEARKQRTVVATVVLEALSSVLPDDTYLTDMNVDDARLRITGVSGRAAEIVPLLEKSGHFNNASFYAPTTRISGQTTDRFSIEAKIVPKLQVTE
jgi:general secretion pathway protein L